MHLHIQVIVLLDDVTLNPEAHDALLVGELGEKGCLTGGDVNLIETCLLDALAAGTLLNIAVVHVTSVVELACAEVSHHGLKLGAGNAMTEVTDLGVFASVLVDDIERCREAGVTNLTAAVCQRIEITVGVSSQRTEFAVGRALADARDGHRLEIQRAEEIVVEGILSGAGDVAIDAIDLVGEGIIGKVREVQAAVDAEHLLIHLLPCVDVPLAGHHFHGLGTVLTTDVAGVVLVLSLTTVERVEEITHANSTLTAIQCGVEGLNVGR